MAGLCWLLWALLGDLPQVQVDTLKSGQATGELRQISASQVSIGDRSVPLAEVLEIRFSATAAPPAPVSFPVEIVLSDGSRLGGQQLSVTSSTFNLQSAELGTVNARKNLVSSVRLAPADPKVDAAWRKLLERETKKDLIVVRKDDKLDFLTGVAGDIDAEVVKFLVDGEEVPVKRERVYGLIFQSVPVTAKATSIVDLLNDNRLTARMILQKGEVCDVSLVSGPTIKVPLSQFRTIDYSLGKIQQLSRMKPSKVDYVPQFDVVWDYLTDVGPLRSPISLGGQTFQKGLSIHSRTALSFSLKGEYRRFQATAGIDDLADDTGLLGDVQLLIRGDDKVLLDASVKGPDEPRKIDLDVSGVRNLEIVVDFGNDLDIADWLSLGDAKVIK